MFGVTVDWLLRENGERPEFESNRKKRNHRIITLLAVSAVWFVAVLLFSLLMVLGIGTKWLIFVGAVPASLVLALVFNCIWGKRTRTMPIVSSLVWTLLAFLYLLLLFDCGPKWWALFLVGVPAQAAVIFWYWMVKNN